MSATSYHKSWIDSGRLQGLLDKLNDGTSTNEDGGISFTDLNFQQYFDLLGDAFRYDQRLMPRELSSIAYRAYNSVRKKGLVTRNSLLKAVDDAAKLALAKPLKSFTMWTNIRLTEAIGKPGLRFRFDNTRFEVRDRLPKLLRLEDYFISGIGDIKLSNYTQFPFLICRVDARTEEHAANEIFSACDAFFGISNILWRSTPMWQQRHAQAHLWMSRWQFIWEGRKFLGKDHIWFVQQFSDEEWRRFPKRWQDFSSRARQIRIYLDCLQRHPLKDILTRATKLLSEGMISPDLSFRLLRYWNALEVLFSEGANKNIPYEKIIRRASFAETDRDLAIMKLDHLRNLRNDYVHAGKSEKEVNELITFLGELICHKLAYLIRWGEDFGDHLEFIEMTDLPPEPDKINRLKKAIERQERVAKEGRHRDIN